MMWTTGGLMSYWDERFSSLLIVHTGSGAHPASYNGCQRLFPQGVKLNTLPHLVPMSRMVELYLYSEYVLMAWSLIN
jgi:hypothetical protein